MVAETRGQRTREAILAAGIALWREEGYAALTSRRIGGIVGVTHNAVVYHFNGRNGLKDAVARRAVADGDKIIVPQLIAMKHSAATMISPADRQRFLAGC